MRVPTLTEVVDWPQLVVVEEPAPAQPDARAEGVLEVCIEEAAELTTAEPDVELPNEPTPSLADVPVSDAPLHEPPPTPAIDEAALAQRIFADMQHQIDSMLDQQLRVAMQPLLNRLADTLALQAREQLALALRDMVALAVSREMIRLRAAAPPSDSAGP
jgi:hypothetical protein